MASVNENKKPELIIGIGPVHISDYLERPQMVTWDNTSQLHFDEYHRWAESLQQNIDRVITENIASLRPEDALLSFPWMQQSLLDYHIMIHINRLDVDQNNQAVLVAQWEIMDRKKHEIVAIERSVYQQPLTSKDYAARVSAFNQLLASLSEEINNRLPK